MSPTTSAAVRRAIVAATRRWHAVSFDELLSRLRTPLHCRLCLPVTSATHTHHDTAAAGAAAQPQVVIDVYTNSKEVQQWLTSECDGYVYDANSAHTAAEATRALPLASGRVHIHIGAPHMLGYPASIAHETVRWAESMFAAHDATYRQCMYSDDPLHPSHWPDNNSNGSSSSSNTRPMVEAMARALAAGRPIPHRHTLRDVTRQRARWFVQRLRDGCVLREAEVDATMLAPATLHARHAVTQLGMHVPLQSTSPYFAVNDLYSSWCAFGDADVLLPTSSSSSSLWSTQQQQQQQRTSTSSSFSPAYRRRHGRDDDSGDNSRQRAARSRSSNSSSKSNSHDKVTDAQASVRRCLTLALHSALVQGYHATPMRGAVLTRRRDGDAVLLLGRRHSGKTTLALHCLASHADLQLTASELFVLAGGTAARMAMTAAMTPSTPTRAPQQDRDLHDHNSNNAEEDKSTRMGDAEGEATDGTLLLAGLPGGVSVGVGAVLGTLRANEALASCVQPSWLLPLPPPPTLQHARQQGTPEEEEEEAKAAAAAAAQARVARALLRNSDAVLWSMSQRHTVHLRDMFAHNNNNKEAAAKSPLSRCSPVVVGKLRGIVYLDWRTPHDTTRGVEQYTQTTRMPLCPAGLQLLQGLLRDQATQHALLHTDVLLQQTCTADEASERLCQTLYNEYAQASQQPLLCRLTGGVNFDVAVDAVWQLFA